MIQAGIEWMILTAAVYTLFDHLLKRPFMWWTSRPVILISSGCTVLYLTWIDPSVHPITSMLP